MVLARVVKESRRVCIITALQAGKISMAKHVGVGFSERNEKLFRFVQLQIESADYSASQYQKTVLISAHETRSRCRKQ